jgi:hypothetical protein
MLSHHRSPTSVARAGVEIVKSDSPLPYSLPTGEREPTQDNTEAASICCNPYRVVTFVMSISQGRSPFDPSTGSGWTSSRRPTLG